MNQANNKSINATSPNLLFETKKLRIRNTNKIIIGDLSINSLPNTFEQLKDNVMQHIDVLVLTENKLDNTFPQFLMNDYSEPYRLDSSIVKWGYQDNFKPVYFFFKEKISRAQKHSQATKQLTSINQQNKIKKH